MKLRSKPADSITNKAFHQVPFRNISEAPHRSVKKGVLGNMLTDWLFFTYSIQEAVHVRKSASLFPLVILDVAYIAVDVVS